jgi:hypothetical protein
MEGGWRRSLGESEKDKQGENFFRLLRVTWELLENTVQVPFSPILLRAHLVLAIQRNFTQFYLNIELKVTSNLYTEKFTLLRVDLRGECGEWVWQRCSKFKSAGPQYLAQKMQFNRI